MDPRAKDKGNNHLIKTEDIYYNYFLKNTY